MRLATLVVLCVAAAGMSLGCAPQKRRVVRSDSSKPDSTATSPTEDSAVAPTRDSGGDYMPAHYYIAHKERDAWAPCIMKEEPVGDARQALMYDGRNNSEFRSSQFFKTRPATAADISVGAELFVLDMDWIFNDDHNNYLLKDAAEKYWQGSSTNWEYTTVTGVNGLDRGVFQASVGSAARDARVSNARVKIQPAPPADSTAASGN